MTGSIILLGATGYAGGLALEAMVRRGQRPIIAGTREDALRDLSAQYDDLPWRIADASNAKSIGSLLKAGDTLATTVGPFDRLGRIVARAAAERGAHYIDSTGEVGFVRYLLNEIDPIAKDSGSVMLPAFGYDYLPGLLAGVEACSRLPDVKSIQIAYVIDGSLRGGRGLGQGTRRTVTEEIGEPVLVFADGKLKSRRMAKDLFPLSGTPMHAAILAPGTEVLFLPRHASSIQTVEVFNGWFPAIGRPMRFLSRAAQSLRATPAGSKILERATRPLIGPAGGPDASERRHARGGVIALARDASGHEERVELIGPNMYELTADFMAWGAEELASGHGQIPGVVDGIEAFGKDAMMNAARSMDLRAR